MTAPLLQIEDLEVDFLADEGVVQAVRGVSFTVEKGRTVALVGESGSGKTVISQAILGILPQNARISSGRIVFRDPGRESEPIDLASYPDDHPVRRSIRGGQISIIFQEPMSSLSPLHTIGDQIIEAVLLHTTADRAQGKARTVEMLAKVGFPDPEQAFRTYPFELSGGLRQRAMIAMALVCDPALLIADEPTTALDVTIQAQILQLMQELQSEFQMAILFITHDLGVVANMADEVVVLYRGQIMESGSCQALLSRPQHPYLRALLHAVPRLRMAPGERLTPLREVSPAGRALLGGDLKGGPRGERRARSGPLLEVEGVRKTYRTRKGGWMGSRAKTVLAVDDVSFTVARGEAFGLVGESGCGKTTVSKILMCAVRPMPVASPITAPTGRLTCWP
jgi:peptide/nickel transport system ATP-binding protein